MKIYKKVIFNIFLILAIIMLSIVNSNNSKYIVANLESKKPIYRVQTDEKKISLTFDVNWAENEYIYEILDVLDRYNVKATFVIMGKWIIYPEGNEEKLVEIKKRGHEIGNHSYVHPMFTQINEGRMLEEIKKTETIIQENIGYTTKLFRFPSGNFDEKSLEFINNLGYKCIQWDVDSVDWKESSEEEEYKRVMKNVKAGSIVLFHNNAKYTPKNLDKILDELINEEGYEIIPVGELIYNEDYYVDENGEQIKNK